MDHDCSEADPREFPGLSPSLVGLIIGACGALPMYLWQMSIQAAVACFIIAGYTAWSWAHVHNQSIMRGLLNGELRSLAINRPARRAGRLVVDPGFWWTLVFGGIMVTGSVWYAGIREVVTLAGVAALFHERPRDQQKGLAALLLMTGGFSPTTPGTLIPMVLGVSLACRALIAHAAEPAAEAPAPPAKAEPAE